MRPDQASHRCLLLGDPERVALTEPLLERVLHRGGHREFKWITGIYKGVSITVLGTGIGGDNTEIAVLELDALHNIDLSRGQPFPTQKKLYFLRVGTSGLLQEDTPIGSVVFTTHAVGVDPLPLFYRGIPPLRLTQEIRQHWEAHTHLPLPWYGVAAGSFFLQQAKVRRSPALPWVEGITYSAPGFYGPQGRAARAAIAFPDLPQILSTFGYEGQRIQNIEMEAAPLFALAAALGHEAGALCLGIAHRKHGTFLYRNGGLSPEEAMQELLKLGLEWLAQLT
uniref:Uridine phosphorylase n=1 Tax=uncultured Bacteroidota bacterium TaxID=152509 RepID=H5SIF9_9BACT|nr:uridine phosphorylase [uncultured Bacteroidetes bacterium]